MKKRFLPISLLLTIIILAQTSFVVRANGDLGKYNPRSTSQATAQSFMKSIRANQETGLIDPAWMLEATKGSQSREDGELNWTALGPDNYGSLTRGIIYDNQDATNKTIYIGTMGGGVFKSVNGGITWCSVSENLMVSSLAQTEDGTIYIGTGDGRGAHNQNGFAELNYETSFVGTGIYQLKNDAVTKIDNTVTFVNDMAVNGNKVYAATNDGLKCYENGNWTTEFQGEEVYGVEVCPNGDIVSVVGYNIYIGSELITNDSILPATETYKIVAVSPSDNNYMYVAYLTSSNGTGNIYYTNDHGQTWDYVYNASSLYDIFNSRGLLDNAMAVYPNNPKKLLIGGKNLWYVRDEENLGIYRLECISDGSGFQIAQSGGAFYYNYTYIHSGIQAIAFNPDNVNEFFVGSEGGIFKGTCSAAYGYQFEGKNRYLSYNDPTDIADIHTSVTRMFSVGFAGEYDMTIGGSLDHGTINVFGDPESNSITTGNAIYPNDIATTNAAETYGAFDYSKAGGPCAISTINPEYMFVTATGSNTPGTPLLRTQTAGYDYDKDNFSYSVTNEETYIENTDAFRTPIALFENYNDTKAVELAKYINKTNDTIPAGTKVTMRSHNAEYPFEYVLEAPLAAGDSIEVQDIISSTFLTAVKGKVYMTRDALIFSQVARWWQIGTITGFPNVITMSKNGDVAYVGTIEGRLYRAEGLTDAVTELAALGQAEVPAIPGVDGTDSIPGVPAVPSVITFEELDGTVFNGQAITSIAINPNDINNVIVTLGNYGNSNYVFESTDGTTFTAKQGNLPTTPVYSSLIESETGKVFVGTEEGLYVSEDMITWAQDATIKDVPVMDIKQQLQMNHDNDTIKMIDEIGAVTNIIYPGVFNEGMIYIATYGRGLYRCDNYHVEPIVEEQEDDNDDDNGGKQVENLKVYPNPIVNEAYIDFEVENNTQVTIEVYDLSGRKVISNNVGTYQEGLHKASFSVEGLKSGTYIVKVQAGEKSSTAKVMVY